MSTRHLRSPGQWNKYIRRKEEKFDGGGARGQNQQIQYNDNGTVEGISVFTFDGENLNLTDDTKLKFGTSSISGSSDGITLSGSTIQIDGTLEGASPLKIGGELQFVSTGDAAAFNFGPNNEAKIYYEDGGNGALIVSGSEHRGLVLSGSCVHVARYLAVGDCSATHAITLPDTSDNSGKVKANAFLSYSSIRFKKNVQPLESPMDTLSKLNGVSYDWKDTGKKDYGFIAEEVGKVLPEIVEWSADSEYANSMDYIRIISFLVEGVKEQEKKITDLQNKLADMSEKLDKIEV
jgi:uncharacterized cupin superfamily protein